MQVREIKERERERENVQVREIKEKERMCRLER